MNDSIAYPFEPRSSSRWMAEMHKQLLRGKQVLLHGNVEDLHLLNGSVTLGKDEITTRRFLTWYFTQRKFPVVAHFDIVDGVVLASPEMRADLERARAASADRGRRSTEVRAQPSPETGQSQQVVRRTGLAPGPQRSLAQGGGPSAVSPAHAGAANPPAPSLQPLTNDLSTLTEPDRALPEIRRAVRQAEVGCAFIIHFSDKLLSDSQRQSEKELPRLILLKKLIQEAELIDRPPLVDQRNALIIVAGQLGGVPTWLYQDNPLLALIHATRPRREERAHALRSQISRFFGGDVLHKTAAEPVVQELADLTDGLMVHDLDAIRRTSRLHKISLGEVAPKKLVDLYKYGQQEDPWLALDEGKISTARERLTRRVIGQDASINALVDMLRSAKVGLSFAGGSKASRPKGVFFFVGPTGVGKTELAKALAALIFGKDENDDSAFYRFDMSEYSEEHAAEKLIGSPPGYVGYNEGGQLTNRAMERPFSLLLFDEIEKANGKIMDKFLQILEDGRLTDSKGQTADFSQTCIIFTSNIGSESMSFWPERSAEPGTVDDASLPDRDRVTSHYKEAVREFITLPATPSRRGLGRPELLNRIGDENILVFDILRQGSIRLICEKFLSLLTESAREQLGLVLEFPDGQIPAMIERVMTANAEEFKMGGRRVRTLMEDKLLKKLTGYIFERGLYQRGEGAGPTLIIRPTSDYSSIEIEER